MSRRGREAQRVRIPILLITLSRTRNEERREGEETYMALPPKMSLCCAGGIPSFSSSLALIWFVCWATKGKVSAPGPPSSASRLIHVDRRARVPTPREPTPPPRRPLDSTREAVSTNACTVTFGPPGDRQYARRGD